MVFTITANKVGQFLYGYPGLTFLLVLDHRYRLRITFHRRSPWMLDGWTVSMLLGAILTRSLTPKRSQPLRCHISLPSVVPSSGGRPGGQSKINSTRRWSPASASADRFQRA